MYFLSKLFIVVNRKMERFYLNLFPLKINWQNLNFYRYSVKIPPLAGKVKILNRLRYALSAKLGSPVFYKRTQEGGVFYTFKPPTEDKREIPIPLSENEGYLLTYEGKIKAFLPDRRSIEFVIEDIIRLKKLKSLFRKKFLKEIPHSKYGNLLLYPYPFIRVYERERGNFLLQVDIKYHLTTKKWLQELFEEGLISPETVKGNEDFSVRPRGFDRTAYIMDIVRASNLKRTEIESFLKFSRREETQAEWRRLLDNETLREKVYILYLSNGYIYPATMVKPVLDFDTLEDIASELLKEVKLPPLKRWGLIKSFISLLLNPLKDYGISLHPQGVEINERNRINYHNEVIDSKGLTHVVDKNSLLPFLVKCKPFIKKPVLKTKILVISEGGDKEYIDRSTKVLKQLQTFLNRKGITLKLEGKAKIKLEASTRGEAIDKLSRNLSLILTGNPDLILTFMPEYGGVKDLFREITIYDYLKGRFLEEGIASQFVLKKTLFQEALDFIVFNLAEQIMGKTANVPYKLSKNLEGADVFIGIDISRTRKKGGGSVNEGAFTKIFFSNGSFLKYTLSSFPSAGEEVTQKAIQNLFLRLREDGIKSNSRIVIHRDGNFRGKEVEILTDLGEKFSYKLELIEVIKRYNPRFFGKNSKIKRLYYRLSDREAVVATYDNTKFYTHQPVRVKLIKGELPLEKHVSYILSFTLLNYSSFKPIKLPATTYHTDRLAKMALRGLKPSKVEGEEMFWL